MAADKTLRHVQGLVKKIVEQGGSPALDVLKGSLEAALAAVMEGEVSDLAGAQHGERTDTRATQRNGYRDRRFDTGLGTTLLRIPKLRQGTYFPSFLKARQRSDDALLLALTECYQQGVSTRRAESIAQALGIEGISKSTVSRILESLDPQVEAFRSRPLPRCPYVFLDARYENVREDHAVRKCAVLVALGVREDGAREVLGFAVCRVENEAFWGDFLRDLKARGLAGVRLVISDAHEGLRAAIADAVPEARWQRCKVHYLRNLAGRLPSKHRAPLMAVARSVFQQPTLDAALVQRPQVAEIFRKARQSEAASCLEESDDVLTYFSFPREHWTKIYSTNLLERLNRSLKARTQVVSIFPNRPSLVRLVGALLLEEHEEWKDARHMSAASMRLLRSLEDELEELVPGSSDLLVGSMPTGGLSAPRL